ncbi:hypothetical protein [uncultured Dialister sp.]|jgi:hypothetical protein|nr:hypothetical protein [uncultured Dialister sp.]
MDKDENKNSDLGESYRIKRYRKFDKVMSTLVPASVPYRAYHTAGKSWKS